VIQAIDRLDDPRIASYARVGDPAWLRKNNRFVAEGRLVVRRLFETAGYQVESVLVTPAALAAMKDVLPEHVSVYVAEPEVVESVTGFNFHRGCVALAPRPAAQDPRTFNDVTRLVALEGIGNPDNVGGIFRNAAAFSVDGVLLDPTSGDPLYRKAIRTSMGAALTVPFAHTENWPDEIAEFRRRGFRALALTPREGARPLDEVARDRMERWILLAGAEGPGLSECALQAADIHVRIPMVDRCDSLNVTVAVGIALSLLFLQKR
jgi:tRNA G18 (ribose-2'-O)-methylase SpoU